MTKLSTDLRLLKSFFNLKRYNYYETKVIRMQKWVDSRMI